MKNISKYLLAVVTILGLTITEAKDQNRIIEGIAVTGTNRLYNEPISDFGQLGTVGFYNLGAYNPGGKFPHVIDRDTPKNTLLATAVDPEFLSIVGLPVSFIDESLNNIPLANVAANVSPTGDDRMELLPALEVDALTPSQAHPLHHVTLGEWLTAKGTAKIHCKKNRNYVEIQVENLIPNRLYTVWGIYETPDVRFSAAPLGGLPNIITTDVNGKGKFKRELSTCPFERTKSGALLLAIDILFHSDQQVYGQVPDLALKSFITGTINHTQLEFIVSGKSLLQY